MLSRRLVRLRTDPATKVGPTVSIVITNRDGEKHLKRLLKGLRKRTNYRNVELVLVDNGSKDGSLDVFGRWEGTKRVVSNERNRSFAAANNQGVRSATGDLVLLANNDIEPIHPDWLGYMVESLAADVSAVGAMLVYPKRPVTSAPPAHPDLSVQHRGSFFETSKWGVRAANSGAGQDPLSISAPKRREVPIVTAACLLARRSDLLANPLDEAYWYGTEDWDLCLRLGNVGKVVIDERAVLFHHEFGTQDKYRDGEWLAKRTRNHQWFNELWGPALLRRLRTEVAGTRDAWFYRGDQTPKVHLTAGATKRTKWLSAQLAEQARSAGWEVVEGRLQACDVAIALDPPDNVRWFAERNQSVAVVLEQEAEWARNGGLDAAKVVVAPDPIVASRLEALWATGIAKILDEARDPGPRLFADILRSVRPSSESLRIGVSTCAPDWERAQYWGDTFLARGIMRAFRRLGHEVTELIADDWRGKSASSCDVIIHLRGLKRRPVARGQWNLLWIISHPDRLEPDECQDYDIIASASSKHAEELSEQLGRHVHFIPQATDGDTFKAGPHSIEYEGTILYAGVARRPHRRGARWLLRTGREFHLYGRNWERFPESTFLRGEHIPNRELPLAYRSAAVVVADHHGSMRANGFVANRLFDVLASNGVVLSDDVRGLQDLFGDVIPTYRTAQELDQWLKVLLDDAVLRRKIANRGRQLVLSNHTLDHRARQWLQLLDELPSPCA